MESLTSALFKIGGNGSCLSFFCFYSSRHKRLVSRRDRIAGMDYNGSIRSREHIATILLLNIGEKWIIVHPSTSSSSCQSRARLAIAQQVWVASTQDSSEPNQCLAEDRRERIVIHPSSSSSLSRHKGLVSYTKQHPGQVTKSLSAERRTSPPSSSSLSASTSAVSTSCPHRHV
jgi:hypothetical protein